MQTLVPTLLLLFALVAVAWGNPASPRLHYLGEFENKTYFLETTARNWDIARQICELADLTMVDIESQAEGAYLHSILDLSKSYWTAGRESYYKFEDSYDSVNTGKMLVRMPVARAAANCASFTSLFGDPAYHLKSCSVANPVICQNSTLSVNQDRSRTPEALAASRDGIPDEKRGDVVQFD